MEDTKTLLLLVHEAHEWKVDEAEWHSCRKLCKSISTVFKSQSGDSMDNSWAISDRSNDKWGEWKEE